MWSQIVRRNRHNDKKDEYRKKRKEVKEKVGKYNGSRYGEETRSYKGKEVRGVRKDWDRIKEAKNIRVNIKKQRTKRE